MERRHLKLEKKQNSFSGAIGFVLAAAGSAVGLGNIWRFPYLAAKDGGGLFLVTYLILALTFGFTMLISEVALGRKTKRSPLKAYGDINKKFNWIGLFACVVPFIIFPYYCVIGGWVMKYMIVFLSGKGGMAAEDGYFTGFITSQYEPVIYAVVFTLITAFVIFNGVNKGIEKISKILMPLLLVLVLGVAIFSITIKQGDVTGLDGLKVYMIPNLKGKTIGDILVVAMDAMGQLFYSISVAMGIMVAYGSYLRDEDNLTRSVNQIEIFDTLVAFLAGVMIIPAVFVFMGEEGMTSGPGLMFIALPKVFLAMGRIGTAVGVIFFLMVFFAALTSSISILEAVVSSLMDHFNMSRLKATIIESVVGLILAIVVCLGYNVFYFEVELPNHSVGQILDIMDYLSNNILMPVVAIGTCILIGWVAGPDVIIDEASKTGAKFGRKRLYKVMVRYIAPVLLVILLLKSLGIINI
ncbi:MAG: sodium-dependent transporter [Lachnospiraceae bacterium]|nr:sodium-dependent transporter [Lachnospiraceae bacterium]